MSSTDEASAVEARREDVSAAEFWYYESLQFTLAAFGIWPYEPPEAITWLERYFALFTVLVAATVYACLAGVIVELIARSGENTRKVDGVHDGLMQYLNSIECPYALRAKYRRFYWCARPYLVTASQQDLLPNLSRALRGELIQYTHGKAFTAMPLFNCNDSLIFNFFNFKQCFDSTTLNYKVTYNQ